MTAREAIVPALAELIAAVRAAVPPVLQTGLRRTRATGEGAKPAGPDATEAVHDYRVALRRLRTVLRALRGPWPKKKLRALGADLKRFADATGPLRDEEVLAETLAELELGAEARARVDAWAQRRLRHQRSLRARAVRDLREDAARAGQGGRAARGTLPDTLARLEKVLADERRARAPLAEVAEAALDKAHAQLGLPWRDRPGDDLLHRGKEVDVSALDAADAEAMHTLRIRFKRLRYTAELFGPLLEPTVTGTGTDAGAHTETDTGAHTAADTGAGAGAGGRTRTTTDPARAGTLAADVPRLAARGVAADAKHAARMQKRLGELHDIDVALQRTGRAWGLDAATRTALAEALRAARQRAAKKALDDLAGWKRRSPK
jgi:CHAD domain-containing protein